MLFASSTRAGPPVAEGPAKPDAGRGYSRGKPLLWAGAGIGSVGLIAAAAGFGTWGGILLGNPGAGRSISGEPGEARRILRVASAMEGLAFTGVVLTAAGAALCIAGGVELRKERRGPRYGRVQLTMLPGPGSFAVAGRF